jgi:hypothetical protein
MKNATQMTLMLGLLTVVSCTKPEAQWLALGEARKPKPLEQVCREMAANPKFKPNIARAVLRGCRKAIVKEPSCFL